MPVCDWQKQIHSTLAISTHMVFDSRNCQEEEKTCPPLSYFETQQNVLQLIMFWPIGMCRDFYDS